MIGKNKHHKSISFMRSVTVFTAVTEKLHLMGSGWRTERKQIIRSEIKSKHIFTKYFTDKNSHNSFYLNFQKNK